MRRIKDFSWLLGLFYLLISLFLVLKDKNYYFIIFAIIGVIYLLIKSKFNIYVILFCLIIIAIFIISLVFMPYKYNYKYFINILENNNVFYIRNLFINYSNSIHNKETSEVINMLMFNEKIYTNKLFLNFKNLGIVHLLTVSGFHINLILLIFNKCLKKTNKKVKTILNLILIIIFGYFLKFSVSFLRIFSFYILSKYFKKFDALYISFLVNIIIFKDLLINYGFLLTYCSVYIIFWILDKKFNKLINLILISICCSLFSNLILFSISNKFYLVSFIFSILITPLISVFYLIVFFSWFIPKNLLILLFIKLIGFLSKFLSYFNFSLELNKNYVYLFNSFYILLLLRK